MSEEKKNIHASLNDFLLLKDHIIAKKPSKKQGFQYVVSLSEMCEIK